MAITVKVEGTQATIAIEGWLDTQTAPELAAAVDGLDEGVEELTLDLSELAYISSAGIRTIVRAHKKVGGAMTVRNVRPEVLEVLTMTGVAPRLKIV